MDQEIYQQKVSDFIDSTSECAREILESGNVNEQLECAVEKAEETVREYPIESVVAGLVSGFIIGKIIS